MANIKSAKKRAEISEKERMANNAQKTRVKNLVKKFNAAIAAKDLMLAEGLYRECVSAIDKAKADGVYHANTASRKVATLSRTLNTLKTEIASGVVAEAAPVKKGTKAAAADKKPAGKKSASDAIFDEAVKKTAKKAETAKKDDAKPAKKAAAPKAKAAEAEAVEKPKRAVRKKKTDE